MTVAILQRPLCIYWKDDDLQDEQGKWQEVNKQSESCQDQQSCHCYLSLFGLSWYWYLSNPFFNYNLLPLLSCYLTILLPLTIAPLILPLDSIYLGYICHLASYVETLRDMEKWKMRNKKTRRKKRDRGGVRSRSGPWRGSGGGWEKGKKSIQSQPC